MFNTGFSGAIASGVRGFVAGTSAGVERMVNEDHIRLAVTGLSRAGKTVFITLRIGQQGSIEVSAFVAICPHPALDGVAVGMRSLVMMRRIATLYAVRPGTAVTIALMRRVAVMSATNSAITFLSVGFTEHALNNLPILKHLAAAIPGASAAAIRIYRLAGITADTCCPIRAKS